MAEVRITNNTDKIMAQFRLNMKSALQAIGVKAVNLTLQKMKSGYGRPIRKTGDLMRDVTYEVENGLADSVDVGNTLHQFKRHSAVIVMIQPLCLFSAVAFFAFHPARDRSKTPYRPLLLVQHFPCLFAQFFLWHKFFHPSHVLSDNPISIQKIRPI